MNADRFQDLAARYPRLRVAIVGDFCLDRYLEIDPGRSEVSIETGLAVHNVINVRGQPGAAGTILNNLVALGIGEIVAVGFCGEDGEGYELRRALAARPGVNLEHFITTPLRRTFTYCKPLVLEPGRPPQELNRLDSKNWTPTPETLGRVLAEAVSTLAKRVDALVLMDQVDLPETGVVTAAVREAGHAAALERPDLVVLADSRSGLRHFPPLGFKMNAAELAAFGDGQRLDADGVRTQVGALARRNRQPVFVTLAEAGIVGALADGRVEHVAAHRVRGPIDVVGAGDAVTANLAAARATGASLVEAMEMAMAAASLVVHQLGTTGTASVAQIAALLGVES
jgi:rfaE bifunctional protein kinase chain/domain